MPVDIEGFLRRQGLDGRVFIAYSGGVDSHVLLHLCANLPALRESITAVYIHHGLQEQAEAWGGHCRGIAEELGVAFRMVRVDATAKSGQSPEEAARDARYGALRSVISEGDAVLLAQHQQDQLETVLLQLFRGSGLKGLSGMPERMTFGKGWLLRPLLSVPKPTIDAYANSEGLHWVEDPSNQSNVFDRNFLRNDVIPLLQQRWPGLAKTVSRSAGHCADADALLSELARTWFDAVYAVADGSLDCAKLLELDAAKRDWVIRHWLAQKGLKMPAQLFVQRVCSELVAARDDGAPVLVGKGYTLRRYRGRLYCLPEANQGVLRDSAWDVSQPCLAVAGGRRLCWHRSSQGISLAQWQSAQVEVRYRCGGEKIRLPKRQGSHRLKNLYQEAGIPPWQRETMPLVYLDGRLAAVGGLWVAAEFYLEKDGACVKLRIED